MLERKAQPSAKGAECLGDSREARKQEFENLSSSLTAPTPHLSRQREISIQRRAQPHEAADGGVFDGGVVVEVKIS